MRGNSSCCAAMKGVKAETADISRAAGGDVFSGSRQSMFST